jgi:hypothetical protein
MTEEGVEADHMAEVVPGGDTGPVLLGEQRVMDLEMRQCQCNNKIVASEDLHGGSIDISIGL